LAPAWFVAVGVLATLSWTVFWAWTLPILLSPRTSALFQ
jgi:hypothetical protein